MLKKKKKGKPPGTSLACQEVQNSDSEYCWEKEFREGSELRGAEELKNLRRLHGSRGLDSVLGQGRGASGAGVSEGRGLGLTWSRRPAAGSAPAGRRARPPRRPGRGWS